MRLQFYVRFHTEYGQSLWLTGNTTSLQDSSNSGNAIAMNYLSEEYWQVSIELPAGECALDDIQYHYLLLTKEGEWISEGATERSIPVPKKRNYRNPPDRYLEPCRGI
ncbi:MAG: CBM20 domain-containing protein [Chitinophagaceae bacterium]|nr:CBM20 domain-containing protein [Chitinophagaceae bacterium]